jgi:hypothetical protein
VVTLGLAGAAALIPAVPAHAAITYQVLNVNDSGPGSLRQAIINANNVAGLDKIYFNIPGAGPHVIFPLTDLPALSDPAEVSGYKMQYGAKPATATTLASLGIVINGAMVSTGLKVATRESTISGVVVNNVGGGTSGGCDGVGICVTGDDNVISGNYVGVNRAGTAAVPNTDAGIVIIGDGNRLGGTSVADRNVVSGNTYQGVEVTGVDNLVQGNRIGTDAAGLVALSNDDGVNVFGGANQVGGSDAGAGNVISGNADHGLLIDDTADASVVQGNLIGTNAAGTGPLGNGTGLILLSDANQIGGTAPGARNVISGNGAHGIEIGGNGPAAGNRIEGNAIGTGTLGVNALGNGGYGIYITVDGAGTTVGGNTPGAGNVIVANDDGGVYVQADDGRIEGNLIGVPARAAIPLAMLGNGGDGVRVVGDRVAVGGAKAGSGNVIGRNRGDGVHLDGAANDTVIAGNSIGTDATGTVDHGNGGSGVYAEGHNAFVGSDHPAVASNIIAHNGGGGFTEGLGADDNTLLGNRIFSNAGSGIDMDPSFGATGSPTVTSAEWIDPVTTVSWTFAGFPADTWYRVEFFVNDACDASGYGEGSTYLGYSLTRTDGSGDAASAVELSAPTTAGQQVTATATRMPDPAVPSYEATSEFSACVAVTT